MKQIDLPFSVRKNLPFLFDVCDLQGSAKHYEYRYFGHMSLVATGERPRLDKLEMIEWLYGNCGPNYIHTSKEMKNSYGDVKSRKIVINGDGTWAAIANCEVVAFKKTEEFLMFKMRWG